jgi:CheY-like chemotaxis protein
MRAVLTATETVAGSSSSYSPTAPPGAPAIVLGGSEDSRLLLRGLLRLHRHRVLLEAPTHEGLERVPSSSEMKILIFDAGPAKGEAWAEELSATLRGRSDLHALVLLPGADPALGTRARQAGAKTVLVRPFAIRDFIEAVDSVGAAASPH